MGSLSLPISKLFRTYFTGKTPLKPNSKEKGAIAETLKKRLTGLKYLRIENRYYRDQKNPPVFEFQISRPSDYHWGNDFEIILNEKNELLLKYYRQSVPVSSLDEIFAFVGGCQEQVEKSIAQEAKRKKVREFKSQAIIAQVKQIAKEDKFDFYTETDTVKLKLYVKMSEQDCIEMYVPFNRFQEVLPNLRSAIRSLRELHNRGIKFKNRCGSSRSVWIRHDASE